MSKNTCKWIPEVTTPNGVEASRLFLDLIDKDKEFRLSRTQALKLYVEYLTSNGEAVMETTKNEDGSPKYKKNRQGQFSAKDVYDFLDFDNALGELNKVAEEAYRLGATDTLGGNQTEYTNAEEVLEKVNKFNNTHKGLVAAVEEIKTNSKPVYVINIYENNSRFLDLPIATREKLKAWEIYKHVFNEKGIDITAMPDELGRVFSAYNIGLCDELKELSRRSFDNLYRKEALTLFYIDKDSEYTERLVKNFGSLENAAQALDDANHKLPITKEHLHLLKMAVNHAQKLHGIDIEALVDQIDKIQSDIKETSPETEWKKLVYKLNKQYKVDPGDINRTDEDIESLSDAITEAITQTKRRIDEYAEQGKYEEGRRLERLLISLQGELNNKQHYAAILDFLKEASMNIKNIDNILKDVQQTGSGLERLRNIAAALRQVKALEDQYLYILDALASDTLTINDNISQNDINNIKQQASELSKYFHDKKKVRKELKKTFVHDLLKLTSDGKMRESEIADILNKGMKDASLFDTWVSSMGRASNPLINAMGVVVRNQQLKRNEEAVVFEKRINRITNKLFKAGYNTEFMYEDERHIISDINWSAYETAKNAKEKALKRNGFKGFELKMEMDAWEAQNTEDRIVDKVNGRKERVPNQNYRKIENFQEGWSQEQIEYYNEALQLKAELESLYPASAQNLYYPVQIRRNMVDAIIDSKGNMKNIGKAVGNKLKDYYTVREDTTDYGMIDGEKTEFTEGNYDNTVKKSIPINYQRQVAKGELLKDFSSSLTHLTSSATNFDAMNEIEDVVLTLIDYANDKKLLSYKSEAEIVESNLNVITKQLYKAAKKANVSTIMTGFADQHLYGIKKQPGKHPKIVKFFDSIIKYTSFKGLAFNAPGAMVNALMGVGQIMLDANSNEFFGYKDIAWASKQLFGDNKHIVGEGMDWLTGNTHTKAGLFREEFDPEQENFSKLGNKRYHNNLFRQFLSKDFTFIGYQSGESIIHMLPMYAILHKEKVLLKGKKISLYDAFDVTNNKDGNADLTLKEGVTDLDGNTITKEYLRKIKGKILYANQSMHGAMNEEDKGILYQYIAGRLIGNFRQWMIEHYSRRYRGNHFDYALGDYREGFYYTFYKYLITDDFKDEWKTQKLSAIGMLIKDFYTFMFRSSTQWGNLNEMQKANIKRVRAELTMMIMLLGLSFALGDPDDHKKEYWRRWWIYQNKRMLSETLASAPTPLLPPTFVNILNSPVAGISTLNAILYLINGIPDAFDVIQSGNHKGENRYIRNVIKYALPGFKDIERLRTMDEDDSLFKVFDSSPRGN